MRFGLGQHAEDFKRKDGLVCVDGNHEQVGIREQALESRRHSRIVGRICGMVNIATNGFAPCPWASIG